VAAGVAIVVVVDGCCCYYISYHLSLLLLISSIFSSLLLYLPHIALLGEAGSDHHGGAGRVDPADLV
jgi:hypothetical protein